MRLRGWLTVTVGLCLGVTAAFQASRLKQLGREEAARDEARGLSEALRWHLELDRSMLDLNRASMERSLRELGQWPHPLEWSGLYEADGQPASVPGGNAPGRPSGEDVRKAAAAAPADRPLMRPLDGGRFLAMTGFRIGGRDLVLAMILAPEGWRAGMDGVWATISACLVGLAVAALLLVWIGTGDLLTTRRPPPERHSEPGTQPD